MIYLRARYYNANMGRFISRDTWDGEPNQPLSYNHWAYTNGNPVNLTDPSGLTPLPGFITLDTCLKSAPSLNAAYVESKIHVLSKSDWLDTYAAAGIAVQCWEVDTIDKYWLWSTSLGPAQVSYKQVSLPYGDGDNLRCYILRFDPSMDAPECFTPDAIKKYSGFDCIYKMENPLNPGNWDDAAILMRRRIKHAIDTCKDCLNTDKFIIAGMAQNGAGFLSMPDNEKVPNKKRQIPRLSNPSDHIYDWTFFYKNSQPKNTSLELRRFRAAIVGFTNRGWVIPSDINDAYILSELLDHIN